MFKKFKQLLAPRRNAFADKIVAAMDLYPKYERVTFSREKSTTDVLVLAGCKSMVDILKESASFLNELKEKQTNDSLRLYLSDAIAHINETALAVHYMYGLGLDLKTSVSMKELTPEGCYHHLCTIFDRCSELTNIATVRFYESVEFEEKSKI